MSREIEHDPTVCEVCARHDPRRLALGHPECWRSWIDAHVAAGRPLRIDVTASGARALEISSLDEITPLPATLHVEPERNLRLALRLVDRYRRYRRCGLHGAVACTALCSDTPCGWSVV